MANQITAKIVKELRERTGVGMMACKKALVEVDGDIERAIELLRKLGQELGPTKGDRIAAEGLVVIAISADNKSAAIVEVNCETDFVAREAKFRQFANDIAKVALQKKLEDVDILLTGMLPELNKSIADVRLELVAQLGENIAVRRVAYLQLDDGMIGMYLHGGKSDGARVASLVALNVVDQELAKDLAMQVAAMKPEYISEEQVPATRIAEEKEIFTAQAQELNAGKPEVILEKIVAGKIKKQLQSITLLGQTFVKDPDQSIAQLLTSKNAAVVNMVRFEVGEGISKKTDDFAAEVAAQIKG